MKIVLYLWAALALVACGEQEPSESSPAYVYISKAKVNPKVQAMLSDFNRQEHRIELKGCEFEYNGTPFKLGMKISELNQVLGNYDYYFFGHYVWKSQGIAVLSGRDEDEENLDAESSVFTMYMEELSDERKKINVQGIDGFPKGIIFC